MADAPKPKPRTASWSDFLWLLGLLVVLFFMWVWGGGPERAEENPPEPFIQNGPVQTNRSTNAPTNTTNPNRPTQSTNQNSSSGHIQVNPI